jgi:hypothetical protein
MQSIVTREQVVISVLRLVLTRHYADIHPEYSHNTNDIDIEQKSLDEAVEDHAKALEKESKSETSVLSMFRE